MARPAEEDGELIEQARIHADKLIFRAPQGRGQVHPSGVDQVGRPLPLSQQEQGRRCLRARRIGQARPERHVSADRRRTNPELKGPNRSWTARAAPRTQRPRELGPPGSILSSVNTSF